MASGERPGRSSSKSGDKYLRTSDSVLHYSHTGPFCSCTGEGGMIVTNHLEYRNRMAAFRNHGIDMDHRQRAERGSWFYEMQDLGYNYRITDFQCALGLSQLAKLPHWLARRAEVAERYTSAFDQSGSVRPLAVRPDVAHAWHLYVVRTDRAATFGLLREQGIRANVHYIPVHLHPYYRRCWGTAPGLCPVAEAAYPELLTLPLFPAMTDADTDRVIESITSEAVTK